MSPALQATLATAKPLPNAPQPTRNVAAAQRAAKQFEGVFVSEFLGSMFSGISTDGPFGGGQGEAMFRSLMLDEYSKQVVSRGGFGLAGPIQRQLLAMQEAKQ